METITADEFKKRYGGIAASQFDQNEKEQTLFSQLKSDIAESAQGGIGKIGQAISESQAGRNPLETGLKAGAGMVETAFSPLAPVTKYIGKGIDFASKQLDKTGLFNDIAQSPGGDEASAGTGRLLEGIGNTSEVASAGLGGPKLSSGAKAVGESIPKVPGVVGESLSSMKPNLGDIGTSLKGAVRDIVPTKQNLIDSSLATGLDLTAMDLKNIEYSTGNPVGRFLSDNNLIGVNRASTEGLINNFFNTNYKAVRSEIAKVKNQYKPQGVPRYADALTYLKQQIEGVPGLEKEATQIDNLLAQKTFSLEDVQKVKELVDKHSSLYTAIGDVKQGVAKQGLANIRDGLKTFIESEVKKNTGADIADLNNKVATAKGLVDAIERRSTRGITRHHLTTRDWFIGTGLTFVNPLAGLAAAFVYKLMNSPTLNLRFARWLDTLSDAQKKAVSEKLASGEVPTEAKAAIEEAAPSKP